MPPATSVTLLQRLAADPQEEDWRTLFDFCEPFVRGKLRALGATADDADEIAQDVRLKVFQSVKSFERERPGSFRTWVRTITLNALIDRRRSGRRDPGALAAPCELESAIADPSSDLAAAWDRDHRDYCIRRLLDRARVDFPDDAWETFMRTAVRQDDPQAVATDLGIPVGTVYGHKSRVLRRIRELREEFADLIGT